MKFWFSLILQILSKNSSAVVQERSTVSTTLNDKKCKKANIALENDILSHEMCNYFPGLLCHVCVIKNTFCADFCIAKKKTSFIPTDFSACQRQMNRCKTRKKKKKTRRSEILWKYFLEFKLLLILFCNRPPSEDMAGYTSSRCPPSLGDHSPSHLLLHWRESHWDSDLVQGKWLCICMSRVHTFSD